MAFFNTILIFGVFMFLALYKGRCYSSTPPGCSSDCLGSSISVNASDPFIRKRYEGILSSKAWATAEMDPHTPLITELRDILLEMAASDSFYFSHIVMMHAAWTATMLSSPNLYTSMCPFTTIVNDSIAFGKSWNESAFIQTLHESSGTVFDVCRMFTYVIMTQKRCVDLQDPPEFPRDCYENGLVFDAPEAWKLFGGLLPCRLTDVFFKLYDSKDFVERAHAAILAYILTPAQFKIFVDHPPTLLFESLQFFVEPPDVSRCCCDSKKSRLEELCFLHNQTVYANTTTEAAKFNGENYKSVYV